MRQKSYPNSGVLSKLKLGMACNFKKENQEAQGELSSAISMIIPSNRKLVIQKPKVRAIKMWNNMTELAEENRTFVARKDYKSARLQTEYNRKNKKLLPTVLFANMMNFKEAETFLKSEEAKTAPKCCWF